MHRPDDPTAQAGHYVAGNPATNTPATIVTPEQMEEFAQGLCQLVEASGQSLIKGDWTQIKQAILGLSGLRTSDLSNLFINASMRFWQRGTSIALSAGATKITASRWKGNAGTGGVATVSKQTFAVGAAPDPNLGNTYLQWLQSTGGTSPLVEQRLEEVEQIDAQTFVFSFWASCASGTVVITPQITQNFGTGGSPSSPVVTNGSAITITTTWTRYQQAITIPSISGKTFGTGGAYTSVGLVLASASTYTVNFTGMKFELASSLTSYASPFQRTNLTLDWLRICRFEWKTYDIDTDPGTVTQAGQLYAFDSGGTQVCANLHCHFPVKMRAIPAITYYSPSSGTVNKILKDNSQAPSTEQTVNVISFTSQSSAGVPSVPASGNYSAAHLLADAEL